MLPAIAENHITKSGGFAGLETATAEPPRRYAKANYGNLRQRVLKLAPSQYQCKFFCGGPKCRYCSSVSWTKEQQAIDGFYSTWITDNIVAMVRPTTTGIKAFGLIQQFKRMRIRSLVNLQRAYEHKDCSPNPLGPGGFAYDPEEFMENDISHYNFGWPDFGTSSLSSLLDMVKVLSFALKQGSVAIHCHAGLGRTGVFIACYLIWENNLHAGQAIKLVRTKRASSLQTSEQVRTVYDFEHFLSPLLPVFQHSPQLSIAETLASQRLLLHGVEERILKFIPKIVYVVCERLLELSEVSNDGALDRKLHLLSSGDDIFYHERIVSRNRKVSISQSLDDSDLSSFNKDRRGTLAYIRTLSHSPKSLRERTNLLGGNPFGKHKSVSFASLPANLDERDRLPPIQFSQSLNRSSNKAKLSKLKQKLPWEMYEKADTVMVTELPKPEAETDSIVDDLGNIDWCRLISLCLKNEMSVTVQTAVKTYKKKLKQKNESWRELISEDQPLVLLQLLGEWFGNLKEEVIPIRSILPDLENEEDSQIKENTNQKWLKLYMCNVFHRIISTKEEMDELTDRFSVLLADWLSRSRDKNVTQYYKSCLDVVGE